MAQYNVFSPAIHDDIFVIQCLAVDNANFLYKDLHVETNSARQYITQNHVKKLLLDLTQVDYFGSEYLGSLVLMKNEIDRLSGITSVCGLNSTNYSILARCNLFNGCAFFLNGAAAVEFLQLIP